MRNALLVALMLVAPACTLAQKPDHTAGGCGPAKVNFNVSSANDGAPAPTPENGNALVYVIQTMEDNFSDAITRVGVDGTWVGANHGNTYFYFSVSPGPHDVCVDWQSSLSVRDTLAGAASLNAAAGSTYYFQVQTRGPTDHAAGYVKLKRVESAEVRLLLGSSSLATSKAKK